MLSKVRRSRDAKREIDLIADPAPGYGHRVSYSEELAERVRDLIFERSGVTEKKMFGGIAWMIDGNMAVATMGDDLLVRLDREDQEAAMAEPEVGPMEMGGRRMRGFVIVASPGIEEADDLERWIETGAATAMSLPPK